MDYKFINQLVGNVDIYLLDLILKGTLDGKHKILDAGCGEGRNLTYFVNNDYDVYGVDINPLAIKMAQMRYKQVPKDHFVVSDTSSLPWDNDCFDAIICSAVLHFAKDERSFWKMIDELVRVLNKDGILFIRMATTIGIHESKDKTYTWLLSQEMLNDLTKQYPLQKITPYKSVVVEDQRAMSTLIFRKI